MNIKVGILCGGYSAEEVISFKTAEVIKKYLQKANISSKLVVINQESWYVKDEKKEIPIDKNDFSYEGKTFDVLFNAIHGTPGENGILQAYFDLIGQKYTGSGVFASALTFDKWVCNRYLQKMGFNCAKAYRIKEGEKIDEEAIIQRTGLPCFVKPNCAGSSFGISKVEDRGELKAAIKKAFEQDKEVLVEQHLKGKELTCGAFSYQGEITALPITEIISNSTFFDFDAKYKGGADEITPARIEDKEKIAIQQITKEVFQLLGLKGFARVDYILVNQKPYIIEANTIPGMSEESLVPQQLENAGIKLSSFFKMMVEEALR